MRNPIRRNRNIGKTQGGRVSNGRAFEKWSRNDFLYDIYSRISESETKWQIFVQNPSKGYFHPCSGDEYVQVLKQLPRSLTKDVKAIILPGFQKMMKSSVWKLDGVIAVSV